MSRLTRLLSPILRCFFARLPSSPLSVVLVALFCAMSKVAAADDPWVEYPGGSGPGAGKHVVLISGDEEYRSEEGLPQLGKILAQRQGFKCTVLFAINPQSGEIDPNYAKNIPGLAALKDADLLIILTRFRDLPDDQMQPIDDYLKAGRPVIGLRTATHAFNTGNAKWARYSNGYKGDEKEWADGFGRLVLGEQWISHHGDHMKESTRGIVADDAKDSPIVRGLKPGDIWGDTDVYGVRLPLPGDSKPIVLGQVLKGMKPDDAPVEGAKNNPMMPVAWTKSYQLPGGKQGQSFATTMGSATDLAREGTRRMVVNAALMLVGLESKIPPEGSNVELVGKFEPSNYGFNGYKKGVRPEEHRLIDDGAAARRSTQLQLQRDDHVSLIGGALAERFQHSAWFETYLQARHPKEQISVRNLAFAADQLNVRQRSEGFGTPDEWLAKTKTDVVLAFFGGNESFAGKEGLAKFKGELEQFVDHTLGQQYGSHGKARLVLFTPIAAETLPAVHVPDGAKHNADLALYVGAMREVASAKNVPLVDLFAVSQKLYDGSSQPLTINGLHLTYEGDKLIAAEIDKALFGGEAPVEAKSLDKIREAVVDKDFYWFNRYRTTDGYSSYGGRSYLKFVDGQTNREVMFRELEVLDVMTANRDARIWGAAQGKEVQVDDSNTPPFIPVVTNKPGAGPNGQHVFLSGEESLTKMTLGPGLKCSLFASEETFPELINPVQMAFDAKGRLFVAAWPTYPHWKPKEAMNDKLLILEDANGDGKADKITTFADGLHNPTGFEFWNGGVLVAMAPDLIFLKDTDGDDKADVRLRVLHGLDSADTHHTANSFNLGPDGALYFQEGVFHRTQVETPYGPVYNADACVWRFEPRTWKVERYAQYGFANPHGHVFDRWGQEVIHDGTGANPYHGTLISGFLPGHDKHGSAPQVYQQRTRPCSGTEICTSRHLPDDWQGNLLVGNVIGFQGILRYELNEEGSSISAKELGPVVSSTDPNFRPADIEMGPDGAIYFVDWHNPIIGHMQHNLRDPSRDRIHGRVYRITHEGRALSTPAKVAGEPIEKLLTLLTDAENRVRYRARIELSARDSQEVVAAARKWAAGPNQDKDGESSRVLEALWLHQQHDIVDVDLLTQALADADSRVQAAAVKVLCAWRERVPGSLEILKKMAASEHPRVRLEAIRAASYFTEPDAVEAVLIAAELPSDKYLDFVKNETMRVLEANWKKSIAAGGDVAVTSQAGARFFLRQLSVDQLMARPQTRAVFLELLDRPNVRDEVRQKALTGLARVDKKNELQTLLTTIAGIDARPQVADESVVVDLMRLLTLRDAAELGAARKELEKFAVEARTPIVRQVALATLVAIDGSPDSAWKLAQANVKSLRDFLAAAPFISDASLRASLYPRIEPLLSGLPANLKQAGVAGGLGRYVRIELPRPGTLTLAEVEVFSSGTNVARRGKASQINTAFGGDAARGIDGNSSGDFSKGGQTHTLENTPNPWWEVDLGEEYPVDSIVVYNRTDGTFAGRLDGFTVRVLDGSKNAIFERKGNLGRDRVTLNLEGGSDETVVRRAAMQALVSMRGNETQTFNALADFVLNNTDRSPAIRALQRVPRQFWPAERAKPLVDALLEQVRKLPAEERTSPAALDALEFADAMAALLPVEEAKAARRELREIGVRVVRVGTLPERMSYDKDLLAVAAGKPVEFVFENIDLMPHNFVIVQPGFLEEVGLLGESTAQQPGAIERQYVPPSNRLLLASNLLQTRGVQKLSFKAPTEPGVYPYVCTYPGHWRRMYGALYVVDDLDQYLAGPEAYLAAHPLPIKDALLKDHRPRTEWKYDDLVEAVNGLSSGRSHSAGKQMFLVANCAACHAMNGASPTIGPDLAKLDPQPKLLEHLKSIVEPSEKINDKYRSETIVLNNGKSHTGIVVSETKDAIKLVENPLAKNEAIEIAKSDVDERQKSPVSIMPKGLLDKLSRDEILDLIAYVAARGDEKSPLFAGGGHDHEHEAPPSKPAKRQE